ncbi:MAG TPA: hypothetical protein VHR97_02720 [Candidatus Baltobacteraceae bacterium]|jgi:hypothetical protein|nr:hypothetical protein [Candidatus Baltobacteraceae bacterium]
MTLKRRDRVRYVGVPLAGPIARRYPLLGLPKDAMGVLAADPWASDGARRAPDLPIDVIHAAAVTFDRFGTIVVPVLLLEPA